MKFRQRNAHGHGLLRGLAVALVLIAVPMAGDAQRRGSGAGTRIADGRTGAPFEITGDWVALVTDDWRYRMLTPPKGNVDFLPVNGEARRVTSTWDPARDTAASEQCRAYGAAGVMRLPGRLRIRWDDELTLSVETDAGSQTRLFHFGNTPTAAAAEPTWQGYSSARWASVTPGVTPGSGAGAQLTVTTTRMRPGYLRKNGVPYSADAVLTEYFVRLVDAGLEYLALTAIVNDPQYLQQPYIRTYLFKKERDGSGWHPTPCSAN